MRTHKSRNQLLFVFLAVGFFVGIIYENLFSTNSLVQTEIFSKSSLQQYLQTEIITEKYAWYVVKERILLLAIICTLGCMKWKKLFTAVCMLACGFLTGMLIVTGVLQLGLQGILLCIVGMFPQGLFYGLAYGMLFVYWWYFPERQWNRVKTIFTILMFSAGMAIEIYVNPSLVKWFIGVM